MKLKKLITSIICSILAMAAVLSLLPVNADAAANPWDPYNQFLPSQTPVVKRHLRGTWISTVINLDWPSAEAKSLQNDAERIKKSKDELIAILDKAVDMNMNAVFFQVSPEGDALYKSAIVPWSRYLTGTFGKDPGFDPLAFAIEEAHKRNLEIHAWLNPYRVSMNTNAATIDSLNAAKSVYKEHPQWIRTAASRFVVDPGIPEARQWVIARVMEVASNYDVDGIHFDDYFYNEYYVGELKDQETYNKYGKSQFADIGDWRRNNTYLLVKELSSKIRAKKSWLKFGISPAAIWANKKDGFADGSNTDSSYTNYSRSFADTKKWVEEELIDYIAPQIYFSFANTYAPYGELATWWSNVCKNKNVHLYIGHALYKVNDDNDIYFKDTQAVQEFTRQLKFNAAKPEVMGSIMFRSQFFDKPEKQQVVSAIRNNLWAAKALVPVMPWKGGKAPAVPVLGRISQTTSGLKLTWSDNDSNTAYYAIYRFNKGEAGDITKNESGAKLIATLRKTSSGTQQFTDTKTNNPENVFYVVTALDRLHNESSGLIIAINRSYYFSDVGQEFVWAVKSIDSLYEKEIIKGTGGSKFNPGGNTTRGDFILMLARALDFEYDFTDNFADVPKGSYYYDAIGMAKAMGIAKGNGGLFKPDAMITREDMMVIVARALESVGIELDKAGEEYLKKYTDAHLINDYAIEAVASLTKAGLIQGSGSAVNPKAMTIRAEVAVLLQRILDTID